MLYEFSFFLSFYSKYSFLRIVEQYNGRLLSYKRKYAEHFGSWSIGCHHATILLLKNNINTDSGSIQLLIVICFDTIMSSVMIKIHLAIKFSTRTLSPGSAFAE